ncbi:hypothetical protein PENNAL_c0003G11395 [Penicillium nalgiovense]|uniref:Biogenesis of lysosome-related organelles complex 1 subunit KXD1 n=1 Tax=Penicillium nalgiovense TaxID=60175 RepID=A0A1V6Z509_PENNA|nr:hypothetical protein PENNAL_c0003G11395 [Penicillium nalgiovense]
MATQRHYYQPTAYPYHHAPSKAPASASLYPISRVSGSPPDFSDASTTAGSRSSGGLTFSSAGEYDSSFASYSGVDVVDVLSDRMQDAFDPTPLDKGLARQAQTIHNQNLLNRKTRRSQYQDWREQANSNRTRRSGQLNAKQQELLELQALAQRRLKGARANFSEGLKTARDTKRDLEWTQKRVRGFRSAARLTHVPGISALKAKAEKAHPEEYRRSSKKYTYDDY